MSKSNVPEIDE